MSLSHDMSTIEKLLVTKWLMTYKSKKKGSGHVFNMASPCHTTESVSILENVVGTTMTKVIGIYLVQSF